MNELRLLPLVIVAVGGLLLLKAVAFAVGGSGGIAQALAESVDQRADDGREIFERAFGTGPSPSRDAVLESLADRREALEERERELDLRENLLRATESRIEERITELREIETRINANMRARQEEDEERFAGLVTMYESMKPKDAARIFSNLEMPILVRVTRQMNARRMAEILAAMDSGAAQRLTVELSAPPADPLDVLESVDELPKIVGTRPAG